MVCPILLLADKKQVFFRSAQTRQDNIHSRMRGIQVHHNPIWLANQENLTALEALKIHLSQDPYTVHSGE